jgi:acyl-CoA thioesterase-1
MKRRISFAVFSILFCAGFSAAQTKIACIGNSITYGWTLTDTTKRYPSVLRTLLGAAQYAVQNDGVNSTTVLKQGNVPYWTNGKFADVFAFRPVIVTVMLGTNDTKAVNWDSYGVNFQRDYEALIDTLNTLASKPMVFLALPPPIWTNTFGIRDSILTNFIIPLIRQIGTARGLRVIDANTPLRGFRSYFADGVHPNAAGEDTIARVFYRAITGALSRTAVPAASPARGFVRGSAVPVFDGCSTAALFKGLLPGREYEFRVFDARGVMTERFSAEASPALRNRVKKGLSNTAAMRWVTVVSR